MELTGRFLLPGAVFPLIDIDEVRQFGRVRDKVVEFIWATGRTARCVQRCPARFGRTFVTSRPNRHPSCLSRVMT